MKGLARLVLLVLLCCLGGSAAAQEPVYASTQAFAAVLMQEAVPFEAWGLEPNGEECLAIPLEGGNLYCFFSEDGAEVCFVAWYLLEYAPEETLDVMRACNRLNMASDGPRFFADGSDCSVTAMMEVPLPPDAAGAVAWQGYRRMTAMLTVAAQALHPAASSPAPASTAVPAPHDAAAKPASVVVTAATARVRSGPGVNSTYLFTAERGDVFPVVGVSGDWYIITSNGRTGFLSMTVAAPVP